MRAVVVLSINLWIVRATFFGEWNLFAHGWPEPPAAP
jgi:hypothetical protein